MKCYIFDLDGTLADDGHRHHHVTTSSDWDAYYSACPDDKPIEHLLEVLRALFTRGYKIVIVTGRPESIRAETEAWLVAHDVYWAELIMRKIGDRRNNSLLKSEAVTTLRERGYQPMMVFEDLPPAVKAWRAAGVPCAQVAEPIVLSTPHP